MSDNVTVTNNLRELADESGYTAHLAELAEVYRRKALAVIDLGDNAAVERLQQEFINATKPMNDTFDKLVASNLCHRVVVSMVSQSEVDGMQTEIAQNDVATVKCLGQGFDIWNKSLRDVG